MRFLYLLTFCGVILISCESKKPVSPRFNHVVLQVSNIENSVDFYTRAFDLKITSDNVKHVVYTFKDGTKKERIINVVFLKFPDQDFVYEMSEVAEYDTLVDFARFHHIGIDVKDIGKAFDKATEAGAEVLVPIRLVQTYGLETKQAFLKGPDGETIELMQIISGEF